MARLSVNVDLWLAQIKEEHTEKDWNAKPEVDGIQNPEERIAKAKAWHIARIRQLDYNYRRSLAQLQKAADDGYLDHTSLCPAKQECKQIYEALKTEADKGLREVEGGLAARV